MNTEIQETVAGAYRDVADQASPIGTVVLFAGHTAPQGWLFCDGHQISQAEYPILFQTVGTKWGRLAHSPFDQGSGTVSVAFVLPDVPSPAPNLRYMIHAK